MAGMWILYTPQYYSIILIQCFYLVSLQWVVRLFQSFWVSEFWTKGLVFISIIFGFSVFLSDSASKHCKHKRIDTPEVKRIIYSLWPYLLMAHYTLVYNKTWQKCISTNKLVSLIYLSSSNIFWKITRPLPAMVAEHSRVESQIPVGRML